MQCPNCNKTGFVTIGSKRYCSNCGSRLAATETPRGMSDIKPGTAVAATPAVATPVNPVVTPATAAPTPPKPVGQPAVLDLRAQRAAGMAAPSTTPAPASVGAVSTPIPKPTTTPVIAAPATPVAANPKSETHPLVQRFPQHPAVAKPVANPLPNQTATQVEALQALIPAAPTATPTPGPAGPSSPALQQVMANAKPTKTPSVLKIGAALAAIAIMGGFVWMQNSPKLAFRAAANQAGIDASLPSYIPSSFRQAGPATVAAGQLTLAFNSPSAEEPIQITQRRTNWDSTSLRENFVARQTDNYLAVQGQGLTIYVMNDSVNWVNRGIWYTVSGTSKLSREQVLKIAYGL